MNHYVLILAGGGGTRLWPKSRLKNPKQLQPLINKDSMLKNTVLRLAPLLPKQNIFIAINEKQATLVKKQLPGLSKNILAEPFLKNTAAAIGLATVVIRKKDPDAIIAVLPSDHFIQKEAEFCRLLKIAFKEAEKDQIILLGIKPERPETGYGHIKISSKLKTQRPKQIYPVEKFVEKPDLETAKEYIKSDQYLWNAGMFIYKAGFMLSEFKKYLPKTYHRLCDIEKALGTKNERRVIEKEYQNVDEISIDYGIIEKAKNLAVIAADIGWSDIGSWAALYEILAQKPGENIIKNAEHLGIDTRGCLIYGNKRLIATVGLSDCVIIDTPDTLLVCSMNKAQDVKKIVEKLKEKGKKEYL